MPPLLEEVEETQISRKGKVVIVEETSSADGDTLKGSSTSSLANTSMAVNESNLMSGSDSNANSNSQDNSQDNSIHSIHSIDNSINSIHSLKSSNVTESEKSDLSGVHSVELNDKDDTESKSSIDFDSVSFTNL
eukprot:CAMPEP_0116965294 /NCGR_PEP_ID=MMETSP0467-20121206/49125_1 /TAXON_ID=283647 /ORGANISM="Mesodinium pulex, Strain SPMC105" /LENGTH=133 /DNA_ID=CAMNT_0004654495 /DNA_START=1169 /DNA_END=1567 /DNA_ORIENTATION=+